MSRQIWIGHFLSKTGLLYIDNYIYIGHGWLQAAFAASVGMKDAGNPEERKQRDMNPGPISARPFSGRMP
jgi:hypothetical protein